MADTIKVNTAPTFTVRDGRLTTGFTATSTDRPRQIALQQDGKILVGGASDGNLALARYNVDGSLDTSFSGDGKLTAKLGTATYISTVNVAPQADGKILVTGLTGTGFTISRYLSNGDLDTTFGTNGTFVQESRAWTDAYYASSMSVLPTGKVMIAYVVYGTQRDTGLIRYNANGTIDTSFDTDGKVTFDTGATEYTQKALVQPDGKILLNIADVSYPSSKYTLVRMNANGTLDTGFSGDGKLPVVAGTGTVGLTEAMALQADGKILVGGSVYTQNTNSMLLIRYNADGSLDTSFNSTGTVTLRSDVGVPYSAAAIAVQKDGKILAVGNAPTDDTASHIVVVRLLSNGTLDQTFGNKGMADAPISRVTGNSGVQASGLTIQPDGKILVMGDDGSSGSDFVVIRYNADGSLDQTFSPPANTLDGQSTFREPYYYAYATPTVLDGDVQIFDAELAAANSYGGASLTLKRHEGANADDVFAAKENGTLSTLTSGTYFSVDGVTIGRVTANGAGTLTLTFASNATQALVNKTMQQIAYANLSDAPPDKVQIDWTFSDGNTGTQGTGGTLKATGSTTVTIIGTNDIPQVNQVLPNQKIATGVAFSYVIPANAFVDPDHDVLAYNIVMSDGSGLPPWLSFNAATRTLSGTPDALDTGTLTIRVIARDGSGSTASSDFTLNVEASSNHVDGTAGADTLAGSGGDDVLQGYAGNDTLDGKAGADMMAGGDGNDLYYVDNASDTVSETATGGTDTVYSTLAHYQLAPNVEYGRVLTAGAGNLTGNELANILYAGNGDNVLDGGLGNDTASYAYAAAGVTVTLSTTQAQATDGSGTDTLRNIENLAGSRFDDNLTGDLGHNVLNGGAGADVMIGGNGLDTYVVDNVGDFVRETNADAVTGGIDTVNASISYTLGANVENLALTGANPVDGTGNALANKLTGNSGNNVLNGGAGADTMAGGLGSDTYYVDNAADVVTESADSTLGGTDTVISTVTRTLGDYQENLVLSGTAAINGNGNSLANTITGNAAANVLNGGTGADKMSGGLGSDTYYVDNAGDTIVESSDVTFGGVDTVVSTVSFTLGNYLENLTLSGTAAINGTGNALANKIIGNGAANTLVGGDGADTLVGGGGKDVLTGGSGSDVFVFNAASESGTTSASWDVISDLVRGQDKIDLRGIDANTATTANDAFTTFIAGTAAFTAAGQLKFLNGVLYGNTDGDADAEFAIQLTGITQLTTADVMP
ncbi:putative Ig domain-containing protein [Telluria mixta]|uniref:Ig domain-containing protein n=1 Tax=Telluria mixta TaxID=34071 RepID=A0ABT2BYT8_9BURK|nr:putative Ig domain-containing protein [Telluria mixta]MCS0630296.1 putative Ig domain-containing protein [Telluria mixta]WEM94395.1 putative Ig domain-containing protein [Telluria mixta]